MGTRITILIDLYQNLTLAYLANTFYGNNCELSAVILRVTFTSVDNETKVTLTASMAWNIQLNCFLSINPVHVTAITTPSVQQCATCGRECTVLSALKGTFVLCIMFHVICCVSEACSVS